MTRLASLCLAMGFFATGCGKDVTGDLVKFADRACACTDAACATTVVDEFVAFAKANKDAKGDEKKSGEAAKRMGGCAVKAGMAPTELMAKMSQLQ